MINFDVEPKFSCFLLDLLSCPCEQMSDMEAFEPADHNGPNFSMNLPDFKMLIDILSWGEKIPELNSIIQMLLLLLNDGLVGDITA